MNTTVHSLVRHQAAFWPACLNWRLISAPTGPRQSSTDVLFSASRLSFIQASAGSALSLSFHSAYGLNVISGSAIFSVIASFPDIAKSPPP
nr:hypothetical protein [Burkholderia vietnamiensis]